MVESMVDGCKGDDGCEARWQWRFGEFRLDAAERTLHHGSKPVSLRDKAFELLTLLISRAPHLVDKETLRRVLWPELSVHDNNLAVTVSALRNALQVHDRRASFIQTVPKRGYRWVYPLYPAQAELEAPAEVVDAGEPAAPTRARADSEPFVGRDDELRRLLRHWQDAGGAAPALAFVCGEVGIGKTTLLQHFGDAVRRQHPAATVAVGRCLELSGAPDPYLPWLEALNAILSGPHAELWRRVIGEQAPSWHTQLPLLDRCAARPKEGHGRPHPSAPSVRELVQALLTAAREQPLLVLLEDFHWADASSVDVLRALDAQPQTRGLLAVVSFQSVELKRQTPALLPLLEDLAARGRRELLSLVAWEATHVKDYLAARFGGRFRDREMARALWERTEGSPFFAAGLAEALAASGAMDREPGSADDARALLARLDLRSAPSISALIRRQLRRIPQTQQRLLSAASVAGPDLSTALLARVLCELPAELERQLDSLVFEHGVLDRLGEEEPVPGGLSIRYQFRHLLFREQVYDALDSHERRALHLRTARALLAAGTRSESPGHTRGEPPSQVTSDADCGAPSASEGTDILRISETMGATGRVREGAWWGQSSRVAAHFGLGGQPTSAIIFWTEAGDQAERAYAPREALSCYAIAEELLQALPREERELRRSFLRHGQGWAWFNLRDLSRSEQCFADMARLARELETSGAPSRELAHEYFTRPWSDELVRRTGELIGPSSAARLPLELQAEALRSQCQILALGERTDALQDRAERLFRLGQEAQSPARTAEGQCFLALVAMNTGQVERARQLLTEALSASRAGAHGRSQSLALHWLAELDLRQGELVSARTLLIELLEKAPAAGDNAVGLARLGDTLARLGELPEAFRVHREAEALFERMEPPRPALYGWLLRELGRCEEAKQLDEAGVARARPLADTHRLSRLLASLSSTRCRLGLLGPAGEAIDAADALVCREHQKSAARMHPLWEARCELETRRRNWPAVEALCSRWLDLAGAQGHAEGQTAAHRGLARALLQRRHLEQARAHAEAAIGLSRVRPAALFDWRSHTLLAEIARRSGENELADRSRAQARRDVDAIAARVEPHHCAAWLAAAAASDQ